jgi:hypothetical protein
MIEIEGSAIIELKNEMNLEASALRYLFTLLPDAYQEVADQQVVEIVDDVVNFGERNTKQATSNPMGNPDKSKRMNNRRDQEKKKEVEASADTKKLDAKLADILEK